MAHTRTQTLAAEPTVHWSSLSSDPNDEVVLRRRAEVLAAAWRPSVRDRTTFIVDRVREKRVLDIGCVAHDEERMLSPHWLHHHVAEAAAECLGVDVLEDGVRAMTDAGYNSLTVDLSAHPDALAGEALFQVILAGELIEHVPDLNMLFAAASKYLTIDGELIITTPNPYAPARIRAGRRCEVWENVDHIMYAFPSGVAELAERHGLVLTEAMTSDRVASRATSPVRWLKRTIRRSHHHRRGFATTVGVVRPIILDRRDRLDRLMNGVATRMSSRHRFTGETAIYVITRGPLK